MSSASSWAFGPGNSRRSFEPAGTGLAQAHFTCLPETVYLRQRIFND